MGMQIWMMCVMKGFQGWFVKQGFMSLIVETSTAVRTDGRC